MQAQAYEHLLDMDSVTLDELLLADSLISTCKFNAQGELILEGVADVDQEWEDEIKRVFNM